MRRTSSLRLVLFGMIIQFVVLAPPAALARDIRVDDECSLRDAITTYNTETPTGGCRMPSWGKPRIYLKTDITLTEPLPPIQTDLIIDGHGHQISGDKLHQIFAVYNHDLSISNLHIVDGYSDEHGGAIYVRGGELLFSKSSVSNSTAIESGGAMYAVNSTITIRDSTINGNVAEQGGGIFLHQGTLNLQQSTLSHNVAKDYGAIMGYITSISIVDSQILHNHAWQDGGGIGAADGSLEIRHSTLADNSAMGIGGALNIWHIRTTISGVTFSDNMSASDGGAISLNVHLLMVPAGLLRIENSSFDGNRAAQRGGAVFAERGDFEITNTTFNDNKAGGNGGALYIESRKATLTHVTIAHNAALNGGGVYLRTPDVLSLRNSLIAGSTGGDCVGGLAGNSGNWIEDGSCKPRYSGDPQLNPVAGKPSYLPLRRESLAINRADPEYCLDADQQGTPRPQGDNCDIGAFEAVDWVEGNYSNPLRAPVISPDIIVDENCSLADAIISANRDEATGGCIAGDGADVIRLTADETLEDSLPDITSELVIEGDNRILSGVQFVVKFGNLTVNNLTLKDGGASYLTEFYGGALYVRFSRARINMVTIKDTWAGASGGAIYSYDSDVEISDSVFANNIAQQGAGGALFAYEGSISIMNSIFSGNISTEDGGAISARSGSVRISRSAISDNSAGDQGGAIFTSGYVELKDSALQRNVAAKGGAIATYAYATVELENVIFADNSAEACPKIFEQIKDRCR